jgi:hypothetical protein
LRKITALGISLMSIAVVLSCGKKDLHQQKGQPVVPQQTISEVPAERSPELMSIPGVVATPQGLCNDTPCIKVYVREKTPDLDQKIPKTLNGYRVVMEETGEIRTLLKDQ